LNLYADVLERMKRKEKKRKASNKLAPSSLFDLQQHYNNPYNIAQKNECTFMDKVAKFKGSGLIDTPKYRISQIQVLVLARAWRFKSSRPHHLEYQGLRAFFLLPLLTFQNPK